MRTGVHGHASTTSPAPLAVAARRVVVVGDPALTQRIERQLGEDATCIRVPGFLSALGEATRAQPDVVIGPAHALAGMAASVARTLRTLAPRARLVLLAPPHGIATGIPGTPGTPGASDREREVDEALAHGFDTRLAPDADDAALRAALGLSPLSLAGGDTEDDAPHPRDSASPPAGNGGSILEVVDPADLSTLELVFGPPTPPHADIEGSGSRIIEIQRQRGQESDPVFIPPAAPVTGGGGDASLGDADLIDHVLRGRGGLRGLALRVIRERGDFPTLGFIAADDSTPPDHAAAAVAYRDQLFGQLHAAQPATDAQLAPWADWLARWLRLEDQFGLLRDLSMKDELTGVYNRRYFNRFLHRILASAAETRQQVTLLVFDIDDFKHYNDTYGHAAGDEILREVAKLIQGSVREHDVVARIGGDEFAVIFWDAGQPRKPNSKHPGDVRNAAARFQRAVVEHRFPKLMDEAAGNLTISGGLAGFPWDGRAPEELLAFADAMAFRSKRQGKNAITFGPNLRDEAGDI